MVVSPIGFVSDHLEVVWDLDTEAPETAKQLGLDFVRAGTPGTDPRFVTMVRELVAERATPGRRAAAPSPRRAADVGHLPHPVLRAGRPPPLMTTPPPRHPLRTT